MVNRPDTPMRGYRPSLNTSAPVFARDHPILNKFFTRPSEETCNLPPTSFQTSPGKSASGGAARQRNPPAVRHLPFRHAVMDSPHLRPIAVAASFTEPYRATTAPAASSCSTFKLSRALGTPLFRCCSACVAMRRFSTRLSSRTRLMWSTVNPSSQSPKNADATKRCTNRLAVVPSSRRTPTMGYPWPCTPGVSTRFVPAFRTRPTLDASYLLNPSSSTGAQRSHVGHVGHVARVRHVAHVTHVPNTFIVPPSTTTPCLSPCRVIASWSAAAGTRP